LYKVLSEKVEPPLFKSFMFSLASDSQKHAALLKGIAESIAPKVQVTLKECENRIGETLHLTVALTKKIAAKEKISEDDLFHLIEKLEELEGTVGEEYSIFVQLKTLEVLSGEINRLYKIELSKLKGVFVGIMNDEEHHREIIATVKEMLQKQHEAQISEDPLMAYREMLGTR
jgi:hypothetical protein